jgi:REP element-mobilizing transposase RayT
MGRNNRVIFQGAIYHICTRGNNRDFIFENTKHKSFLLKQIKEYIEILDFELLAYVIMDNHYHLLIKTNKCPIDKIMFYINNVIGKYLTRELNRTGHVLEKRYRCKLVTTDEYLIWLLRYIHRNPIRAHICDNLDNYRLSSHYFYKNGYNSFVKTDFILNILSPRKASAQMQYLELVSTEGDDTHPSLDFEKIQKKYKLTDTPIYSSAANDTLILAPPKKQRKSLEEILSSLELDSEIIELLRSGSKKRTLTNYKLQFIKEALNNKYTLGEISTFLCVGSSSLCMLIKRYDISAK